MNITIDTLDNLTTEQLEIIALGQTLLQEARRDLIAMKEYCRFRFGEYCITLRNDGNCREYMLNTGIYQVRNGNHTYELEMTEEAIFDAYKQWAQATQSQSIYKDVSIFRARVAEVIKSLSKANN